MAKARALLVFTSVAKKSDAACLAKTLVAEKLAACVSTLPAVESRYVWKKKLCVEAEWMLLIKTVSTRYLALQKRLKQIHPYECPEILAFRAEKVSAPYLQWLQGNTKGE